MVRPGSETFSANHEADYEADYGALRHAAGIIGARRGSGRDVLRVAGSDALSYLQGQCTQDLTRLADGESADALLLSPQGKLDALVRVTRIGAEELVVDVQAGYGEAVKERLDRFKLRVKAVVEPLPWRCVSIRGPNAREVAEGSGAAEGAHSLDLPFDWNGVVGVDLLGEEPGLGLPESVRICGVDSWEAVRVEAGIPAMGSELDARTIPAEADLLERCVSTTKGCYTGQELVARLEARGNRVARHLRGLVALDALDAFVSLESELEGETAASSCNVREMAEVAIRGSQVISRGKPVGTVTSSAWSPALGTLVGLAYVHRDMSPGDRVEMSTRTSEGQEVSVPAEVRDLPLA